MLPPRVERSFFQVPAWPVSACLHTLQFASLDSDDQILEKITTMAVIACRVTTVRHVETCRVCHHIQIPDLA
jgi:hypothetical protein